MASRHADPRGAQASRALVTRGYSLMTGLDLRMARKVLDSEPFSALVGARTTALGAGTTPGPAVLTGGLPLQCLRPATGTTLVARAEAVRTGRRQAVARCGLPVVGEGGAQKLCAVAQGAVPGPSAASS